MELPQVSLTMLKERQMNMIQLEDKPRKYVLPASFRDIVQGISNQISAIQ
jgi:hypothetical protein